MDAMSARIWMILALGLWWGCLIGAGSRAWAGDEDVKQEKKPVAEAPAPADTPAPAETEELDMSGGESEEEQSPEFKSSEPTRTSRVRRQAQDLDHNIDYSRLIGTVEPADETRGVVPPAEGFRGYMPNMVAVGYYDRTPGYGGLIEYSWNRIGAGVYGSYRPPDGDGALYQSSGLDVGQTFAGLYALYRLLPWGISPYFLMGAELATNADESFGGLAGLGVEVRIFKGLTGLLGWTYHGTVGRGFLGGAIGWSF